MRSGFTASLGYTFSKSIDDDSVLGGQRTVSTSDSTPNPSQGLGQGQNADSSAGSAIIAQNWLDLSAERGLSTFDQRHLLSAQIQYTTGVGVRGGTLMTGWRGTLFKDWTALTQITALFCAYVPGKVWHSKWRYELQYDVLSTQIHYEKEPRDCDFLAAPLGEKNCSYDRRISTIRWATSTAGHPIASVDDGKTWNTFTPSAGAAVPSSPTVEEVYISWEKKEE